MTLFVPLAVIGLLGQVPEAIAEHGTAYGLATVLVVQVGSLLGNHFKGRARDGGRRTEYARLELKIDRHQKENQDCFADIGTKFAQHAAADAKAFAEITNTFTAIEGNEKLREAINENVARNLATIERDVAEINRRDLARLERQAGASDRRQS